MTSHPKDRSESMCRVAYNILSIHELRSCPEFQELGSTGIIHIAVVLGPNEESLTGCVSGVRRGIAIPITIRHLDRPRVRT